MKPISPDETVIYLGRAVSKNQFRAYVYDHNGEQKLVNSWDEFQEAISSGLWFAQKVKTQPEDKPKGKAKGG